MPTKKGKYQPAGVSMTPCRTELGGFIRARRLELNLRQAALAEMTSFFQTEISALEVGKLKFLNPKRIEVLAKALRCDPEQLRKRILISRKSIEPTTELGRFLQRRRKNLGLSLTELAEKLGTVYQSVYQVERRGIGIRHENLDKWAKALECNISELMCFAYMSAHYRPPSTELGRLIRTKRLELGFSQRRIAKELSVSWQFISLIEIGKVTLVEAPWHIERLASVLRLAVDQLKELQPARTGRLPYRIKREAGTLGEFFYTQRIKLGFTLAEVAQKGGISKGYLGSLETNNLRFHPRRQTLFRVAEVLECEIPAELLVKLTLS